MASEELHRCHHRQDALSRSEATYVVIDERSRLGPFGTEIARDDMVRLARSAQRQMNRELQSLYGLVLVVGATLLVTGFLFGHFSPTQVPAPPHHILLIVNPMTIVALTWMAIIVGSTLSLGSGLMLLGSAVVGRANDSADNIDAFIASLLDRGYLRLHLQ
jgi:hypothetical protein